MKLEQHNQPSIPGIIVSRGYSEEPNRFSNFGEYRWFYHSQNITDKNEKIQPSPYFWKSLNFNNSLLLDYSRNVLKFEKQKLFDEEFFSNIEADFKREVITADYREVYYENEDYQIPDVNDFYGFKKYYEKSNLLKKERIISVTLPIRRANWFWIESEHLYPYREDICEKLDYSYNNSEFGKKIQVDSKFQRYVEIVNKNTINQKRFDTKTTRIVLKNYISPSFGFYQEVYL
jgi:hypothetical protein